MPLLMVLCPESPVFLHSKHGYPGRYLVLGSLGRLRAEGSELDKEYTAMTKQGPVEPQPILLPLSQLKRPQIYKSILTSVGLAFFTQVSHCFSSIF